MHLVVTSDTSGSQLFINNRQIEDSRLLDSQSWDEDLGTNFRIGNRYTSSSRLNGKIAAFRIYDRVLTDSEIAKNYEAFNKRINGRGIIVKFGVAGTDFNLDSLTASWDYSYSYYDTYELDLNEMTQFRYDYFDEVTVDYQIDLPRAGKSTTVYLYNYTKSDWDYFKTTVGGAGDIQDSITFTSLDYIDSGTNTTRIKFTGFSDTEFVKDSIVANYSWEYDVQDKYSTVLSDMTPHRLNTFEQADIIYSLQTTADQNNIQPQLYNYSSSEWTVVGTPFNTIKDTDYNGSLTFTSTDFIHPTDYTTRIFFDGIQDSFLTLNMLENNYSWSHYYTESDFGYYNNQGMEGEPYANMNAIYRNVYKTYNIFDYAGEYVVTWNVSDGMYETQEGQLIEIIYPIPSISVGELPDYIEEDEQVYLESGISFAEEYAQEAEYQFFWEFGDGHHSVDRNPTHKWSESGSYEVTLHVRDLYGNYYNDTINVEVEEKLPEIIGSTAFYGIEGQAILLDISVSDSIFDRKDLTFTWYDENDQEITEFANNQKPIVILNDGIYNYSLEVEDINGYKVSSDISITVDDIPPVVFISSYMYHGDQNSGSLTLTAYAFDYYEDMNTLDFSWRIAHNGTVDTRGPFPNMNRSSIQFDATKTAIYQGEVSVYDSTTDITNVAVFSIVSVIDSNGNGFSDEFEADLAVNGENIYDYYDSDSDGLSDLYELTYNETWYLNPDTDGDGLYDGVYRLTGIGERTAGTDPGDSDSDDDDLLDGDEVYGWTISTELEGEIFVSSDPWLADTDGDGWTDYEEFIYYTHPRRNDTDFDGVIDPLDPYPLKADIDEDGLSDSEELAIGTTLDNADTDGDGINDGDEVRGLWGFRTDPLSADSDHDFTPDNAEFIEKSVSIRNRMSLDQPVIIKFDDYFEHATFAQISFLIAFGEANDTANYGVQDVPNLNIKITKVDNNLILYEGETGGNRYFSQIVDFQEDIEGNSFNYYGQYVIQIDKVGSGCLLEQFDINVGGYLDPNDDDSDNDGIMDGIEMDTLVQGINSIDFDDYFIANDITANTFPPPSPYGFSMETGSVDISNTIDQSVVTSINFKNMYRNPVVVAYINSRNDDQSVEVRVDNVTAFGCDIFMEEPDDGSHGTETINYIVMEGGEYTLPDGLEVKAGRIVTSNSHEGSSSYGNWNSVTFKIPFGTPPVILHSLNTYNNQAFKTSIASDISDNSFKLQQESAETGTSTSEETIGWIAIESGKTGTIDNVKYETLQENDGDADGVDDSGHMFFFQTFTNVPEVVVVKQITANNGDGSWARSQGTLSGSTHVTYAEEDQVGDSERNHPDEYLGLVAFEYEISFVSDYTPTLSNDFSVARGTTIIADTSTTATIYEGTDYNLASGVGVGNSFIRITDTMHTGMGRTAAGGNQNHDRWAVRIQNPDNIENSITFERDASGTNSRISWEIIQYTGPVGGVNEFIVRDAGTATTSGTTATVDGAEISTISNANKVAVLITGQYAVADGRGDIWRALFTADLIDVGGGNYTSRFTRGKSVASNDGVSYVVVEFTGSNWADVQRLEIATESSTAWTTSNYNTAYVDVTIQSEGGSDLTNYTRAFMYQQYRTDNDATGVEDAGDNVELISNTQLRIRNSATKGNRYKVCWIIENLQTEGTVMSVEHGWFFKDNGGSEENVWTEQITEVSKMSTTSIVAQASMDGSRTDFPRSAIDYRLTSPTEITFTESDSGEEKLVTYSVIQWPTEPEVTVIEEEPESDPESEPESYQLTITDIGRVYDANITIEVSSENTPSGYGTINITLVKEDISGLIDDVVLIDYDSTFDQTDVYFNQFVDLTPLVSSETIHQFYGTYRLNVVIFNNNTADVFNVTKCYIETDTYIKASESDIEAWITDPSRPDTDGDTITDYEEIYGWTRGSDTFYTNPLSADSDGDGANDKIDRHPTKNVMIKISPLFATHRSQAYWEASPKLEIAISYELNGDENNRHKIFTPAIRATEDLITHRILWFKYSHYRTTNFAENDINYYVDIDDNPNVQPEVIDFGFSLWHMDVVDFFGIPLWDTWLAGESVVYSIGDIGNSETFNIYYTGIWGGQNELHAKVETISIDKSNMIAIYKNDTVFNGHYQDKERMNVIILNVTDTAQNLVGTPFVNGPNAIVIPTRLFTQTKLNGYLEREELDQTPLYSAVEGEYEFISVGRNGTTEEGSDEVDFVFIRYNINAADAMTVLDLLITVIVNNTTEEEVVLYKYQSTKENNTSPILMNLHKDVLGFIPWVANFKNSDQGSEPADFLEFWAQVFVGAVMAVVYLVIMIGVAIAQFFIAIVRFVAAVFMEVLSFLGPLLWLIIRAILLIFVYILLAIELIFISIQVLTIGVPLLVLSMFNAKIGLNWIVPYGVDTCAGFYEVESSSSGRTIRFESWIVWGYWPFFDLYFPLVNNKVIFGDDVIQEEKEGIIHEESSEEFADMKPTASLVEVDPVMFAHTFYNTTSSNDFYTFNVTYYDSNFLAPDSQYGTRLHLIDPDGNSLGYYEMDTIESSPDYSSSVVYNYTIDVSGYTYGLWHYYITTKDSFSGNVIEYPENNYFIGPDTSDSSQYLMMSKVSNSITVPYYRPEGWITDEFYFTVDWFDIVDNTEPINVSVVIVPAQTSSGTGVSNTYGVKKFLMQPTESTPDYSDSVEYYTTVNFTQLGYTESEIGVFHYYFEAFTDSYESTYGSLSPNNDNSHSNEVLVKPADGIIVEIDAYVSNGNPSAIDSDTTIRYIATVSDYTTVGISDPPKLSFSSGGMTDEYNMTHYYTSSDNTEEKYYLDIKGSDLKSGKVDVDFDVAGASIIIFGVAFVTGFFNFDFLSDTVSSMMTSVITLGTVPISLFNIIATMAIASSKVPTLVGPILGTSIGVVVYTAVTAISNLVQGATTDNFGQLLGFAISSLLLWIIIKNFDIDRDEGNMAGLGFLKTYMQNFVVIHVITTILTAVMGVVAVIFPDNEILGDVLLFISRIFTIVPTLGSVMFTGMILNGIVSIGNNMKSEKSLGGKIFLMSFRIYRNILFFGALVGFLTLLDRLMF